MNDSYIDSISGVSAVRPAESQMSKDKSLNRQQIESSFENILAKTEELQICDNTKQLDEQVTQLNKALKSDEKRIEYSIYKETNTVIFRVINTNTNEVLKEIPSTKLIDFSVAVLERFGLIADKEV